MDCLYKKNSSYTVSIDKNLSRTNVFKHLHQKLCYFYGGKIRTQVQALLLVANKEHFNRLKGNSQQIHQQPFSGEGVILSLFDLLHKLDQIAIVPNEDPILQLLNLQLQRQCCSRLERFFKKKKIIFCFQNALVAL
jgi:hypothetical protein